jgi:BMFP domain-containing protein YqiC
VRNLKTKHHVVVKKVAEELKGKHPHDQIREHTFDLLSSHEARKIANDHQPTIQATARKVSQQIHQDPTAPMTELGKGGARRVVDVMKTEHPDLDRKQLYQKVKYYTSNRDHRDLLSKDNEKVRGVLDKISPQQKTTKQYPWNKELTDDKSARKIVTKLQGHWQTSRSMVHARLQKQGTPALSKVLLGSDEEEFTKAAHQISSKTRSKLPSVPYKRVNVKYGTHGASTSRQPTE